MKHSDETPVSKELSAAKQAEGDEVVPSAATQPEPRESAPEGDTSTKENADTEQNSKKHTSAAQGKSRQPKGRTTEPKPSARRKSIWPWLFLLVLLVCLALVAVLGYWGDQKLAAQETKINALLQQLTSEKESNAAVLQQLQRQQTQQIATHKKQQSVTTTKLSDIEQRVNAQGKRLRAMSDTSREDWLLAEAEYLLKLANQRVLIERSAGGAEGLLIEADAILREIDAPELHPLRRAIAKDLAALRLTAAIDIEGIYLELVGLAENIGQLPLHPRQADREQDELPKLTIEETESLSVWGKVKRSFSHFLEGFKGYYRISYDEPPEPLLPPEDAMYLQQNLRLVMERAQLALLREQQDIYRQSLDQAQKWVEAYFPESTVRLSFSEQLVRLKKKHIVQSLPDITGSLNLLHEHIERLHNLNGISPSVLKQGGADSAPTSQGDR